VNEVQGAVRQKLLRRCDSRCEHGSLRLRVEHVVNFHAFGKRAERYDNGEHAGDHGNYGDRRDDDDSHDDDRWAVLAAGRTG
jgi:hypothetical protein